MPTTATPQSTLGTTRLVLAVATEQAAQHTALRDKLAAETEHLEAKVAELYSALVAAREAVDVRELLERLAVARTVAQEAQRLRASTEAHLAHDERLAEKARADVADIERRADGIRRELAQAAGDNEAQARARLGEVLHMLTGETVAGEQE